MQIAKCRAAVRIVPNNLSLSRSLALSLALALAQGEPPSFVLLLRSTVSKEQSFPRFTPFFAPVRPHLECKKVVRAPCRSPQSVMAFPCRCGAHEEEVITFLCRASAASFPACSMTRAFCRKPNGSSVGPSHLSLLYWPAVSGPE
jgi:hypothetical protein